jgi:hypothetical protein
VDPDLEELLKSWPIAVASDVPHTPIELAGRYAKRGTDHGTEGEWWQVWTAIQDHRKLSLGERIDELRPNQRRSFALWAFARGATEDGLAAYDAYLRKPGRIGPFAHENAIFYRALTRCGRGREVPSIVDSFRALRASPPDQLAAARVELAAGDAARALRRVDEMLPKYHDLGELWAFGALVRFRMGDAQEATRMIREAAKLDFFDEELRHEVLEGLGMVDGEWRLLRRPYELPDEDECVRRFVQDPGTRLVPTDSESPHVYGGVAPLAMPDCLGCGHPIRAWFTLDVAAISHLRQRLPSWPWLLLVGCVDCCVWMGRHDYQLDFPARRMTLLGVGLDVVEFGEAVGRAPEIPRQWAGLQWLPPIATPDEADLDLADDSYDGPLVAGQPLWTQAPQRVYCPRCRHEMVYVAAMSSTHDFEPPVHVNNESGFQYHFACDSCSVLSVIAQWT